MSSPELTSVLEVAVFGLAIVQALTILLTARRERDVKELRELVDEQRLRLAELRAWLAGRNASQRRTAPESETSLERIAELKASDSGTPPRETEQPRISGDAAASPTKALGWQREVAARLQSGIKAQLPPTEQATKPASATDFKWFKDDPHEPREVAEARGVVAGLEKTYQPQAHNQDSFQSKAVASNTELDEVEKTLRAIRLLKED
jgi:hypothetical protein